MECVATSMVLPPLSCYHPTFDLRAKRQTMPIRIGLFETIFQLVQMGTLTVILALLNCAGVTPVSLLNTRVNKDSDA